MCVREWTDPGKGNPWTEAWRLYLPDSSWPQVCARARVREARGEGAGATEDLEEGLAVSLEMGWATELLDLGVGDGEEQCTVRGREGSLEEVNFWAVGDGCVTEWHL